MPKVYVRLQSSFVSLAWPWSSRSLPKENQWECSDPRLGSNVIGLLVLLQPNICPTQSLTGWYFVTWLVGWLIAAGKLAGWLADCLSNKISTDPSCDQISDQPKAWQVDILSNGWLASQLQLAGWLTTYQTKCQPDPSCHQISDQPKAWQVDILSNGWLASQLQLASWLAGWLPIKQHVNLTLPATKYLTNPKPDKLIFCQMAGWPANCSWLAGWLPIKQMSTWPFLPPNIWPTQSLTSWYFVKWLVGQPIAAGWLADYLSNKMSTWPSPGRDILRSCVWLLWSHRPVVRCT